MRELNPHISVDCVIFGFDFNYIKVLLVKRTRFDGEKHSNQDLKLPGSLVYNDEDIDEAAHRVLLELTGLKNIYLEQIFTFGSTKRTGNKTDVDWLTNTTHLHIDRIVTIAYFSLIKLQETLPQSSAGNHLKWMNIYDVQELAFDHVEIVHKGIEVLKNKLMTSPVAFELLPKKFTIRQLQTLFEAVFNKKLDNRNFRKKISTQPFIVPLNEKQVRVAHKPARLYKFDKKLYKRSVKESVLYSF